MTAQKRNKIQFAPKFRDIFQPARYKVFHGGRGGGKSHAVAVALLAIAYSRPVRVLCAREYQVSIADSVHKLLSDKIAELGLASYFTVTRTGITSVTGSEFIFKGLHHNISEIKSLEGIDYAWVEEAHSVSRESWDLLIPTIRKENSEIWLTFNPMSPDDETYKRFVLHPPSGALVVKVGWQDNPWFPKTLHAEMERCRAVDPDAYAHIWGGEPRVISDAQIFKGRYEVTPFETPDKARFFHGVDWGFACLGGDTLVTTDNGDVPIRDIKAGDRVLTRDGYRKVLHAQGNGYKKVYDVDFGYGVHIIATGDHRIFTNDGWKEVEHLKGHEEICMMKSSLTARFINGIRTANIRIISTGNTGGQERITNIKPYTGRYGNIIKALSRKAAQSITLMGTRLITALKIWHVSLLKSIRGYIIRTSLEVSRKKKCKGIENFTDTPRKTGRSAEKSLCGLHRKEEVFVKSAESLLRLRTCIRNFAARIAGKGTTCGIARWNIPANGAARSLWRQLTGSHERHVLRNVPIKLSLRQEKEEVFDITVENGEYFANGILVHNCDPTALVRMFIQDDILYIDAEAYGTGIELDETPALFDTIPTSRHWPIKADSARPETISFMARKGFRISAAKKWAGSVLDGIALLKSFTRILIHPRCKHTAEEFRMYSYKVDRANGDILPVPVDAWNHAIDAARYALDGYVKRSGGLHINPAVLNNKFTLRR